MLLRVLGPLEIAGGEGPIALPANKPRVLLAALAIERGRPHDADALIDALWGEDPPASAGKLLQVYVSQLRKVLPPGMRIATEPAGYVLQVHREDVDAERFETLAAEGRLALAADNAALAASLLRRATELWRGPAFADVRYEEFAREEAERLETLRRLVHIDRFDAELRLGRHREVLGELRAALSTDPTDERLAMLAMTAAYRVGGGSDALSVYETVRRALQDDLGTTPGSDLTDLRDRIARRDPTLAAVAGEIRRPRLPVPPDSLIGRERELAELTELLTRPSVRLVSLTGAGGSGKTRLALELARVVEGRFANGATLVELASLRDPALVLPTLARALEIEAGPDVAADLASALALREQLLVVDNIEHLRSAAPQLVRLLAAAPRVVIVVTSRVVLHVSGEHVYPVTPLPDDDAVELFADRALAADPSFTVDAVNRRLVASVCRRLDGLPLAIELAAARVRGLGLRTLDARLASRLTVLTGGPRDLPARQQTLRETLAWSVNLLEPAERDALAGLAVFPAGCTLEAAAVVAGAHDDDVLGLVDHHLVQALDIGGVRRYRLLETVREYAYELLEPRRAAVESAFVDWMLALVRAADMNDARPRHAQLPMLDAEVDALREALRIVQADEDSARELALAAGVWRYWWIRGTLAEGRAVLDGILERRGVVATQDGARAVRAAASLAWSMGDRDRARSLAMQALETAERIGDPFELHTAHNLLGVLTGGLEDFDTSERHHLEAIRLAEVHDLGELVFTSRLNLGVTYLDAGRLDDARAELELVLDHRRDEGLSEGTGFVHLNLGAVEFDAGDLTKAESHFAGAAAAFRAVGFTTRLANALQGLAAVEARTDRAETAARHLGSAASMLGETGWGADGTSLAPGAIDAARSALGDERFEELFQEGAEQAARDHTGVPGGS